MVKILVAPGDIREIKGEKNGKPYHLRFQHCALQMPGAPFPAPFDLSLGRDQAPYAPGEYALSAGLEVKNGRLEVNSFNVRLQALK